MSLGRYAGLAAIALGLASCQSTPPSAPPPVAAAPAVAPAPAAPPPVAMAPEARLSFADWLEGARREAARRGIHPETIAAALTDIEPLPKVIENDRRQAEFTQTFWRYLDNSVTPGRVNEGRALMQKHAALLASIEREYGVPARVIVALWGLETNFGRVMGDFPTIAALATLAYDDRRSAMFREELFNALVIIDRGNISADRMKGSWAGAMGNTQFMPSTFLRHAVDEDHDGRIDIWTSIPDTLGSAANYLKDLGWDKNRTWGREVSLPPQFDAGLASLDSDSREIIKPLKEWKALGVTRAGGDALPDQDVAAALVLPAGITGPAFLVYDDFRIILKWNHSTFYALAVGYLADELGGAPPLVAVKHITPPLKREEVVALQTGLTQLGLFKGEADGVLGAMTRQAVRAYQRKFGLAPDGYADPALVTSVQARSSATASLAPTSLALPLHVH